MTKTLDNKSSMCDRQLATCYLLVKSMYSCYYMCEYLPVKWEHVFDCLIEKVYQLQFNDKVCLTCVRKKYFQLFLSHRVCLTSVFCFCYPQTSFRLKSTLNMCKRKERCGRQQLFLTNLSHRLQWYFLIKKCLSVCGKCFTFLTSSEHKCFQKKCSIFSEWFKFHDAHCAWPMIGQDIYYLFRTTECQVTKLVQMLI